MAAKGMQKYGAYAFILAVIIAIIIGLAIGAGAINMADSTYEYTTYLLIILGAVVGFLNIADKEIARFLLATIALVVVGWGAGTFALLPTLGMYIAPILSSIALVATPAAIIVGLKEVWNIGSSPVL